MALLQFELRLPAKKFRKHVCVGRGPGAALPKGAGGAGSGDEKRRSDEVAYAETVPYSDGRPAAVGATNVA